MKPLKYIFCMPKPREFDVSSQSLSSSLRSAWEETSELVNLDVCFIFPFKRLLAYS